MTDILSIHKRPLVAEKSPEELLSRLRPVCSDALDASLNCASSANRAEATINRAEVTLLLRREDEHFHVKSGQERTQKIAWGDRSRRSKEPRMIDDWENIRRQEVDRALSLCKTRILNKMINALNNDPNLISVEVVLKFKDGKFNWVTYKEELGLC